MSLTSSAFFWAVLSKPLRESLRQAASVFKDSGDGCHAMVGSEVVRVRGQVQDVCALEDSDVFESA